MRVKTTRKKLVNIKEQVLHIYLLHFECKSSINDSGKGVEETKIKPTVNQNRMPATQSPTDRRR